MGTLVCDVIGAFIVVGQEYSLLWLEVFSFWEPPWSVIYEILSLWESLWIWWSVGGKLFYDTWVASKYLINAVSLKRSSSSNLVISWRCQPFGSSLRLPMANDEQMGAWLTRHSRQPVPLPSPYVVVGLLFFVRISYSIIVAFPPNAHCRRDILNNTNDIWNL